MVSLTNKTDRHDIIEILLKVVLNTTKETINITPLSLSLFAVQLLSTLIKQYGDRESNECFHILNLTYIDVRQG